MTLEQFKTKYGTRGASAFLIRLIRDTNIDADDSETLREIADDLRKVLEYSLCD